MSALSTIRLSRGCFVSLMGVLLWFAMFEARADDLTVSCPGGEPGGEFSSLSDAVLSLAGTLGPHRITVTGSCLEKVSIEDLYNLLIEAPAGGIATLESTGPGATLQVNRSHSITVRGLTARGGAPTVSVSASSPVTIDHCTIEGSQTAGLHLDGSSLVQVTSSTVTGNRGRGGAVVALLSHLSLAGTEVEPTRIHHNDGAGVSVSHGTLLSAGTLLDANGGCGLLMIAARGQFSGGSIQLNEEGGVELREQSRLSIGGALPIRNNGSYGIRASKCSQVTLFGSGNQGGVTIEGHSEVGLDVLANSQAWIVLETVRVCGNGTPGTRGSAGIRLSGGSQLCMDGGTQVTDNAGVGILVDVLSSVKVKHCRISGNSLEGFRVLHLSVAELGAGTDLGGNDGGPLSCDRTALVLTDLLRRSAACSNVEGAKE